jgi:hypothetical protein
MALPDCLLLPVPRQPGAEVRAGRAYRDLSGAFMFLLTLAIALFLAPFLFSQRLQWPLWIASGISITAIVPLRAWGIHRGRLSYFVHGTAVEGRVVAVEPAGEATWRVRYEYDAGAAGNISAETTVYDAPAAPLRPGDPVAVLYRPESPRDSLLPALAGILPDAPGAAR